LVQIALNRWEAHVRALGKPSNGFSDVQREAIAVKAREYDERSVVKIINDHIARGRFTLTWPELRRPGKASPELDVEKMRYCLIRNADMDEARDWDQKRLTTEYNAYISRQTSAKPDE